MRFVERLGVLAVLLSTVAVASPVLPYQGRLDKNGKPLSGTFNLQFTLYDAPTAGNVLWQDSFSNVAVVSGAFSVSLGSVAPIDSTVLAHPKVFVGVAVQGPGEPGFTALNGRQQLLTNAYATGSREDFDVPGTLTIGSVSISSDGGTAQVAGSVNVQGGVGIAGDAGVAGNLQVGGTLQASTVVASNVGTKVYDSISYITPTSLTVPLDLSGNKFYRILIQGDVYLGVFNIPLRITVSFAGASHHSQWTIVGNNLTSSTLNSSTCDLYIDQPNHHDTYDVDATLSLQSVAGALTAIVNGRFAAIDTITSTPLGGISYCGAVGVTGATMTFSSGGNARILIYQLPN